MPVLPATTEQLALARRYVSLVAEARYAEAWQLLTPERQVAEPLDDFFSAWSAWGRVMADDEHQGALLWPSDEDEVRADVWLERPGGSGHRERIVLQLARSIEGWRIADERGQGHHERPGALVPASSADDVARRYVAENYGPMWLADLEVLDQEPFEGGEVVVFRVLNPLLDRKPEPTPTGILLFALPSQDGWQVAGGREIGTIVELGRYAVSCAWTWLRFTPGAPTVAAFYCSVEDSHIAAIELDTVEDHTFRTEVLGRRSVVFHYAWDSAARWPAQQPRSLRLYDAVGRLLDLPTSAMAGGQP
jgi:hypothetical protein